jgi:alanine dehydrogenase
MHLWLRSETKPNEQRACLSPSVCAELIAFGYKITVEECPQRIFSIDEFTAVGCATAPRSSWVNAPKDAYVVGLKELPEADFELVHRHIMFAHVYKNQDGWQKVLSRFTNSLLDLEFLNINNRRVAAFGYYAGFAGCAVGLYIWAWKILHPDRIDC